MTHKKIAKLANVSTSTVSKALSGSKEVSTEIADEIKRLAIETGYFKEKSKRKRDNLKHKTAFVAVVCPEIVSVWYSEIITRIKSAVEDRGGKLAVYIYDFDQKKMESILEMLVVKNEADGIILFYSGPLSPNLTIPLVLMGPGEADLPYDIIYSDMRQVFRDIISYLKELGHKKIGFAGERNTMRKYTAYKAAMGDCGLQADEKYIYIFNERFEEIGYRAAGRMIESGDFPTAVVAAYDEIALGLVYALEGNGVSVPKDVSVVGINDIPTSAYAKVPLTTVNLLWKEQCEPAVELLYDKIFNDKTEARRLLVEHRLIERKTVSNLCETTLKK